MKEEKMNFPNKKKKKEAKEKRYPIEQNKKKKEAVSDC